MGIKPVDGSAATLVPNLKPVDQPKPVAEPSGEILPVVGPEAPPNGGQPDKTGFEVSLTPQGQSTPGAKSHTPV